MKEVLIALADYNREVNKKLAEILRGVPYGALTEDLGCFYKSILGTLEHIVGSELFWLRKYNGFYKYESLSGHRCVTGDLEAEKNIIRGKPEAVYETLAEVDVLLAAFVRETKEADLAERVTYVNSKGVSLERTYWHTILHVFNHGTHHRGEISALLDRKGVANDYSGFNLYVG